MKDKRVLVGIDLEKWEVCIQRLKGSLDDSKGKVEILERRRCQKKEKYVYIIFKIVVFILLVNYIVISQK